MEYIYLVASGSIDSPSKRKWISLDIYDEIAFQGGNKNEEGIHLAGNA